MPQRKSAREEIVEYTSTLQRRQVVLTRAIATSKVDDSFSIPQGEMTGKDQLAIVLLACSVPRSNLFLLNIVRDDHFSFSHWADLAVVREYNSKLSRYREYYFLHSQEDCNGTLLNSILRELLFIVHKHETSDKNCNVSR